MATISNIPSSEAPATSRTKINDNFTAINAEVIAATSAVAGKAAASHTHAQADVTGLVSDLAGKASSTHTHAQADVTNLTTDLAAKAPTASPTFTGIITSSGARVATSTAMSALEIDVTKLDNVYAATGNATLTFSATPATDTVFGMTITTDGTARTITVPSSFSANRGEAITSFVVPASSTVYVYWKRTASGYNIVGDPVTAAQAKAALAIAFSDLSGTATVAQGGTGLTKLGTANQVLAVNSTATALEYVAAGSGTGDVVAASKFATDNAIIRANGTDKGVQSSAVTINDAGDIEVQGESVPGSLSFYDGAATSPKRATVSAPVTISADYTIALPAAIGTAGQVPSIDSVAGSVATLKWSTPSGSGTVTKVSVAAANGFTGTVANDTSTPAITIIPGAITPTSVNGITFTGASTPTLEVTGTTKVSGTNTGDNAVNSNYSGLVSNATHTGDATGATALTLATVNSNVGSYGSATAAGTFTVNAKGLITAAGSTTVTPAVGSITGLGTNVATALAVNVGSAGAPVVNGGALGTPSSGTLTSCTGLPTAGMLDAAVTLAKMANLAQDQVIGRTTASTGVPETFTVTAAARTILDDATTAAINTTLGLGTGSSPQFTAINIGDAADTTLSRSGAGDLQIEANVIYRAGGTDVAVADGGTGRSTGTTAYALVATGTTATGAHQTLAAGATTEILVGGGASALPVWTTATGSGAPVRGTSPTLATPVLGTPQSGTLTNCTGLPTAGIVDAAVTLAKLANLAQDQFIGRTTASTGVPETATITAAARTVLDDATVSAMLDTLGGTAATGTGAVVRATSPTLVTPVLGTPSSGTLTSCTIKGEICVACSDEGTALTTGTAKLTFRMPYAMTLTAVRASVNTAPTGSTLIVDINEGGTTILSTRLSIDASEKTSTTAATAAVISDSALADDAEMTIDIDQVGSTVAGKGLKVWLIGTRT